MTLQFKLRCEGKDGVARTFRVEVTADEISGDEELHVRVLPPSDLDVGHWFDLTLHKRTPGSYRIGTIDRNKREYGGRGIPDALLPDLAKRMEIRIWSSVKMNSADPSERRTDDADRMWKRLETKGLATWVEDEGRYCLSHVKEQA